MTTITTHSIDEAQRGDIFDGKIEGFNGGRRVCGKIIHVSASSITLSLMNGRSRRSFSLSKIHGAKIERFNRGAA